MFQKIGRPGAGWRIQAGVALLLAIARPGSAQSTADDSLHRAVQLPTVMVTARRVEESAQDVPMSMVVLGGASLDDEGFSAATDLPERVSGLTVSVPNPRITSFAIRGLGSNSYNDGIESSVGLFVDGIYLGRQGLSIFDLVDIERIEILRGPQGTLFGKNTTAGAINILTQRPRRHFGALLESSLGDYGERKLRGTITGSLPGSDLAGRLTGYLAQRDGLVRNLYDHHQLNNRDRMGLRGQILWTPSAELTGRFIAEYGRVSENCCVYPLVAPLRAAVKARDDYMEYQRSSLNPYDRVSDSDGPTHYVAQQQALSAQLDWRIDDQQRLVSISAWRAWRFVPINDDETSLKLVNGGSRTEQQQFTQELRLDSHHEGFDTTLGLFYLHRNDRGGETATLGADLSDWIFGGLIREQLPFATRSNTGLVLETLIPRRTLDGMTVVTPYTDHGDSLAGFGDLNWPLTDELTLSAGLRYTYEWKGATVSRSRSGGDPAASPLSATDNLAPLGQLIGQDLSGYTFNGLLDSTVGGRFRRHNDFQEGDVSGEFALGYAPDEDLMLYGSASRGYKSGGINLGVPGATVKPTFRPEIATAYEVGAKSRWWDRRLSLTLALYRSDVRNYQALTFDESRSVIQDPRQSNLLNVGAVRLQGVELEGLCAPRSDLQLRAGLSYNSAITTDFRHAPDENSRTNGKDLSGQQLYNAPRWTGTAGLEKALSVTDTLNLFAGLDYSFRTGTYGSVEHGRSSYIDGYSLTNLRIGLRDARQRWDLGFWVRNVFDSDYVAAIYPVYGVGDYGAFAGDPRSYGATLRIRFD